MIPLSFKDILRHDKTLAKLTIEAHALNALASTFNQLLPQPLRRSCRAIRICDGELVLSADSSAIAARLRILSPSLLITLARKGYIASHVRILVTIRYASNVRHKTTYISQAALDTIENHLPAISHPEVNAALTRLVSHHRHLLCTNNQKNI